MTIKAGSGSALQLCRELVLHMKLVVHELADVQI